MSAFGAFGLLASYAFTLLDYKPWRVMARHDTIPLPVVKDLYVG